MPDNAALPPESLPAWDLGDLYPAMDSPALTADLAKQAAAAQKFNADYAGKLAALDGDGLARAIAEFEAIDEVLGRVMSYAGLLSAADVANPDIAQFQQSMQERGNHPLYRSGIFHAGAEPVGRGASASLLAPKCRPASLRILAA